MIGPFKRQLLLILSITKYSSLFTFVFVFLLFSNTYAAKYPGFKEINDKECVILDNADIQKLPSSWHKYNGYIKKCSLKQNKSSRITVWLVSVWANDYLDDKKCNMWEDFPHAIFIDDQFNQIGTFPEGYPMGSSPTEPFVYYGKWKKGIPTEIRIDVYNQAVSGDYYYAPLIWNEKIKKYEMKDVEEKSGKRPKK
jgi:hypothetical protein